MEELLNFRRNLKKILEEMGRGGQADLARKSKVSASQLNDIKNDRSFGSEETRRKIAKGLGIPYELLTSPELPPNRDVFESDEFVCIKKVRARLSAGSGSLETDGDVVGYFSFRREWLKSICNLSSCVMMDVAGDSMEPLIHNGDSVLIDASQKDIIAGKIYAIGIDEEVVVKRVDKAPGKIILISENRNNYPPLEVSLSNGHSVRVLGQCVWLNRDLR